MKFNSILINVLASVLVAIVFRGYGQVFTETRNVSNTYKVTQNTKVDITNKYGKIHLIPWEFDSVRFDIDMKVQSSSESRLEKVINSIDFDFTATPYYVSAKTLFTSKRSGFINELVNLAEAIASGSNDVEINYVVMVPEYVELNIDNKYGDVYLNDTEARIRLTLSNGNLKAHDLNNEAELDVSFGDVMINSVAHADITLSYVEMELRDADQLDIESKSSKIRLDGVNELRVESRRDKFNIEKINQLEGSSVFSDFYIDEFFVSSNVSMKYGNLNLDFIAKDFTFLKVNAEWADIQFFFEKGSGYSFNINHFDTNIYYPEALAKVNSECIDEDKKQFIVSGEIGDAAKKSDVRLKTRSGNVTIFHK